MCGLGCSVSTHGVKLSVFKMNGKTLHSMQKSYTTIYV